MIKNITYTLMAQIIFIMIGVLIQIYWALKIAPDEIGIYYKYAIAKEIIFVITTLSIDQAIVARGYNRTDHQSAMFITYLSVLLASLVSIIVYSIYAQIDHSIQGSLLVGFALTASGVLMTLANVFNIEKFAAGRVAQITTIRTVSYAFGSALSIIIIIWQPNAYAMVVRDFIFSLFCAVAFFVVSRPPIIPRLDWRRIRPIAQYAMRVWLINVVSKIAFRIDYVLMGSISQLDVFGMYAQLRSLGESVLNIIVYQVQTILFVGFVNARGKTKSFSSNKRILITASVLMMISILVIWVFSNRISEIVLVSVLGDRWLVAAPLVPGIGLICLGIVVVEVCLAYLKANSSPHLLFPVYAFRAVAVFVLLSLPQLTVNNASWVLGIITLAMAVLSVLVVRGSHDTRD